MEEFYKGLYVTLFGMGLVFLSLALIMCAIWLMERLFRREEREEQAAEGEALQAVVRVEDVSEEDEVAVAIAVALATTETEEKRLEQGKWLTLASAHGGASPWTVMGRQITMNSRFISRETKRR